jgi:type IV pilus assembly protein PilE
MMSVQPPAMHMAGRPHAHGFTLIEMMITVLILGVITAIVLPQYKEHTQRARRAEARATLLAASQFMQRLLDTNNGSYRVNGEAPQLPQDLRTSPPNVDSGKAVYTITVQTPTDNQFTLTATRKGAMASDECGDFTIDQRGRLNVNNASRSLQQCTK